MFLQLSLYTRNVYLNIWTFLFDLPCYSCYGTTSTSTKNHHVNFPWKQVMKKHISAVLENIQILQNSAENTPLEFPLTFLEVWIFSGTVFSCIKSMAKNDWFVIASKMTPSLGFWQSFTLQLLRLPMWTDFFSLVTNLSHLVARLAPFFEFSYLVSILKQ